ncbi:MAG: hypothetical protein AAF439_06880 [Pseudomonadota bacterium]
MIRLTLCFFLIFIPARAEMPIGHNDPEFKDAIAQWLDGNNNALHTFHRLSGNGNVAALIMHRRVSKWTVTDGPENIDYAWLDFAENSPLALAFGISWHDPPEIPPDEEITRLLDLGELRAAAMSLARYERQHSTNDTRFPITWPVIRRLFSSGLDLPWRLFLFSLLEAELTDAQFAEVFLRLCVEAENPSTRFQPLEALCTAVRTGNAELERNIRAALFAVDNRFDPKLKGAGIVSDWLTGSPDLPYRRICEAMCPAEVQACVRSVFERTWRLSAYLDIGSPVETIVPQKVYLASRRASRELWNKLLQQYRVYDYHPVLQKPEALAKSPSCLLDAVATEAKPWRIDE